MIEPPSARVPLLVECPGQNHVLRNVYEVVRRLICKLPDGDDINQSTESAKAKSLSGV